MTKESSKSSTDQSKPLPDKLEAFFYYMNERENIRLRKERGEEFPWTDDEILQKYKFTNVKRALDRTSRHYKENYYDKHRNDSHEIILLNCAIFRYFGHYPFIDAIGWQSEWNPEFILKVAKARIKENKQVFTGAYVITNQGIKAPKEDVVVNKFISNFYESIPNILAEYHREFRWEHACKALRKVEGFGGSGFMAKEVLQDAILTPVMENAIDLKTWSPCGLGARRGLNRLYGREIKQFTPEQQQLDEMRGLLTVSERYLNDYMPELNLHDVQFSLCEFDKYERVKYNEGRMRSTYKRPKTKKEWF